MRARAASCDWSLCDIGRSPKASHRDPALLRDQLAWLSDVQIRAGLARGLSNVVLESWGDALGV